MDCNREEAIRAKNIAEKKMQNRDFSGALKIANKAQQLFRDLENISQMIMVCDVHCAAEKPVFGNEKDWYAILKVEQTADEGTIKKQYRKFALQLHPDKNKFPGTEAAFKLIGDAQRTLLDQGKRSAHDMRSKVTVNRPAPAAAFHPPQNPSWHPYTAAQNNIPNFSGLNFQQQRQPPTQAGFSNGQRTFWAKCPYCAVRFQYYTDVLNRSLCCQNCSKYFVAYDSGAVPQATNLNQSNFPRQGVVQNQSTRGVDQGSQRKFTTENVFTAFTPKAASTSDAQTQKTNGKRGRKQTVESSESCDSESSIESDEDVVINGDDEVLSGKKVDSQVPQNVRRSGRHKQHVSYKENLSDEENTINPAKKAKGSGSHFATEEMADEDKPVHKSQGKEDKKATDHREGTRFEAGLPNGKNTWEASADGIKGNSKPAVDGSLSDSSLKETKEPEHFDFPDPEFNDYDKEKKEECFSVGQIWALYDTLDAMPRFYARIRKVFLSGFKLRIIWLEPDPDDENEIQWVSEGLPASCGNFKHGASENTEEHKNAEGVGIQVSYLTKVKGFVCVFAPMNKDPFLIPPGERFRFSHRVPSFVLTGEERQGVPKGSFELDPASLPGEIFVSKDLKEEGNGRDPSSSCPSDSETGKPMVGSNNSVPSASTSKSFEIPESEFYSFDADKTKEKFRIGQIWALYGDEDGLPKYYGEIKKIDSHPVFKIYVRWLFPVPSDTVEWSDPDMPTCCGKFNIRNSSQAYTSTDSFSHLLNAEPTGLKGEYTIVPRRGEIWALYRNWTRDIKCSDLENWEYDIVQVLEDNYFLFRVCVLDKVDGFNSVFKPQVKGRTNVTLEIPRVNQLRFSHQIPCFQLTNERNGSLRGCWELDPAALPPHYYS
ncbi:hypothetical protein F3Y22_tig00111504pilonHSYRG00035 [Hibiscus syriacus]|uniref:J domain-containing protein n=1 Tax=Hibiscus syriacus TaxID=106335 RepID=A0A6A2YKF2_HIBSY|nr:hypothetical protein F3Y22_tig00111504pilonHSYRG00035 [Hibiscus syriacus]